MASNLRFGVVVALLNIGIAFAFVSMNKNGDLFVHSLLGGDIVLSPGNGGILIETTGQTTDLLAQMAMALKVAGQLCWLMPGVPRPQFNDIANFPGNQIRYGMASAVIGSDIYIIGGYSDQGVATNDVQVFQTTTNTWKNGVAPLNAARAHSFAGATGDGRFIFVFGGFLTSLAGGVIQDQTDDLQIERYDVLANTWTTLLTIQMPFGHHRGSSVVVNDIVYFFGGYETNGQLSDKVSSFDMDQQVWKTPSQMNTLLSPRARTTAVAVDQMVYLIGGLKYIAVNTVNASEIVHAYDTTSDSWSTRSDIIPRYESTSVLVQGIVILMGGRTIDPPLVYKDTIMYNSRVDLWKNNILGFMNSDRELFASAVVADQVYVFGGGNYTVEMAKPCF